MLCFFSPFMMFIISCTLEENISKSALGRVFGLYITPTILFGITLDSEIISMNNDSITCGMNTLKSSRIFGSGTAQCPSTHPAAGIGIEAVVSELCPGFFSSPASFARQIQFRKVYIFQKFHFVFGVFRHFYFFDGYFLFFQKNTQIFQKYFYFLEKIGLRPISQNLS